MEIVSPGIHKVTSMLANKGINLADRNVNGDKLRNVQLLIEVVVACLLHTQEDPGSTPGRGSYLRQVSLH